MNPPCQVAVKELCHRQQGILLEKQVKLYLFFFMAFKINTVLFLIPILKIVITVLKQFDAVHHFDDLFFLVFLCHLKLFKKFIGIPLEAKLFRSDPFITRSDIGNEVYRLHIGNLIFIGGIADAEILTHIHLRRPFNQPVIKQRLSFLIVVSVTNTDPILIALFQVIASELKSVHHLVIKCRFLNIVGIHRKTAAFHHIIIQIKTVIHGKTAEIQTARFGNNCNIVKITADRIKIDRRIFF